MTEKALKTVKVPLETPIVRGELTIDALTLRKPHGGDFRGVSMGKLGQMDYDEVRRLLPRINLEGAIQEEIDALDGDDVMELAVALTDFLFTARRRAEFQTE